MRSRIGHLLEMCGCLTSNALHTSNFFYFLPSDIFASCIFLCAANYQSSTHNIFKPQVRYLFPYP